MKSKYKISRANERLKVVTIEPNNKSNWKQPTKPNEWTAYFILCDYIFEEEKLFCNFGNLYLCDLANAA